MTTSIRAMDAFLNCADITPAQQAAMYAGGIVHEARMQLKQLQKPMGSTVIAYTMNAALDTTDDSALARLRFQRHDDKVRKSVTIGLARKHDLRNRNEAYDLTDETFGALDNMVAVVMVDGDNTCRVSGTKAIVRKAHVMNAKDTAEVTQYVFDTLADLDPEWGKKVEEHRGADVEYAPA